MQTGERHDISRRTSKRRSKRHKRRQRIAITSLTVGLLVVLTFSMLLIDGVKDAKQELLEAQSSLISGTGKARQFDIEGARSDLNAASKDFIDARQVLSRPAVYIAAWLPIVGSNIDAVDRLCASGAEVSHAALSMLLTVGMLSDGKTSASIKYDNGRLDLTSFNKAIPYTEQARVHLLIAQAEEQKINRRFLLPQLSTGLDEYSKKLAEFSEIVNQANLALHALPTFFGSQGGRRYFLAVQNNAELRATGGLIGNYGIITASDGEFGLNDFGEIHSLQRSDQPEAITADDFRDRYDRFKSTSKYLNANMSPDFPAVSKVLLQLYKGSTGENLDGILSIDPVGLSYLLEATGPIKIPGTAQMIDSKNIVQLALIDAYKVYRNRGQRKSFLETVAVEAWIKVLSGEFSDSSLLIKKVAQALSAKHILLYSMHVDEQRLFRELGYAGALHIGPGDYLQVVVQNDGANKVDVYLDQSIEYQAIIQPDGSVESKVTLTLINGAPTSGLPTYVSGEEPLGARNGQSNAYVSVYVPGGSRLLECSQNGKPGKPEVGQEKNRAIFSHYLYIPAGERRYVTFTYANSVSLAMGSDNPLYSLDWQAQPVIREPAVKLKIKYPAGYQATLLSEGLADRDKTIEASGTLQCDTLYNFQLKDVRHNGIKESIDS